MLKLTNINVTLSKNTKLETQVLHNLNLDVAAGEFVIIIGSNGSGKSTMFNTISGYLTPDSGRVLIGNQDVTRQTQTQRAELVAIVMQEPRMGTMENMTIEENLSFAYLRGKTRSLKLHNTTQRRAYFKQKLTMLNMGLEDRLNELVGNLSGGQRQALSLIMAIIADYKLLLLDEITAALDPKTAESVISLAAKLVQEEKRTAILITHDMHYALRFGSRTLLLSHGRIIREYDAKAKLGLTPSDLAANFGEL